MKLNVAICLISAIVLYGCDKKALDVSSYNEKTVFNLKPLSKTNGKAIFKAGPALCFFGDLDAAHYDSKKNKFDKFWLTLEKFDPKSPSTKTMFSKKVDKKALLSTEISLNLSKLSNGLYGYFLCSGDENKCMDPKKKLVPINIIMSSLINKKKVDRSPKVYSANFFMKRDDYLIGQQQKRGFKFLKEEYIKEFQKHFSDQDSDTYWSYLSSSFKFLQPHPVFLPLNKERYDSIHSKEQIIFEFPSVVPKECDIKMLMSLYKENVK